MEIDQHSGSSSGSPTGKRAWRRFWSKTAVAGALALAAAGLLGHGQAVARPGGPGCGGGIERLERKLETLDLSPETQAAVDRAMEQARANGKVQRKQLREAHARLRTLLEHDAPAAEAVMAQADEIGALRTAAQKQRLRTLLELRSLVGAERWKELDFGKRHGRS